MPITIKTAEHAASLIAQPQSSISSPEALLQKSCYAEYEECKEVFQSSFRSTADEKNNALHSSTNGFIRGAVKAYSYHHHLLIRPEDIWFAILTQLSIYINKHAEELRGKFVAHEGKKELEVVRMGDRYRVDNGSIAEEMTHLLQKSAVDPDLRRWVMPTFTTTTKTDEVVASIFMMGALQKYFTYKVSYLCGIPSVTLLGEKADWEDIVERLEKLKTLGDETTQWYQLLKPVLSRFVATFDTPDAPEISDFWARMIHRRGGSGIDQLSGWLSAFCLWDENGRMLYRPASPLAPAKWAAPSDQFNPRRNQRLMDQDLCLDGQRYGSFDLEDLPRGYATVPVEYNDNGYKFEAVILAGSVGIQCSSSGEKSDKGEVGLDTVQAASGWFVYEKKKKDVAEKEL